MVSTAAAALKVALVIAMCAGVLLHSSTGQQPPPSPAPSDCPLYCSSQCTPACQTRSDDAAKKCDSMKPNALYGDCFYGCTNNKIRRGSCFPVLWLLYTCDLDSCSSRSYSCSMPCVRSCCESCVASAYYSYNTCKSSQEKVFGHCMGPCMTDCNNKCVNGSLPYTP